MTLAREPWCDARDLDPLMGHDARCTQARRGWQANYRHLAALDRERREDERVGREIRLAGAAGSQTECVSCGEERPRECASSERPCGHHCNHSWSHDRCCWCRHEAGVSHSQTQHGDAT